MRRIFVGACLLTLMIALPGCLKRGDRTTVNPDGSGKSAIEIDFDGKGIKTPAQIQQALRNILICGKGVDAWGQVSFTVDMAGRAHFKGTAFFKNLSDYSFGYGGAPEVVWAKSPDGGGMTLVLNCYSPHHAPRAPTSGAELDMKVKVAREEWRQTRLQATPIYSDVYINLTYLLPGKVDKAQVFGRVAGGVELVMDGKKMLANADKFMNDDQALREALSQGHYVVGVRPDDELAPQMFFGQKGKVLASVSGELKPQFDYAAEAAAARGAQAEMFHKLGLPADVLTAPAGDEHPAQTP